MFKISDKKLLNFLSDNYLIKVVGSYMDSHPKVTLGEAISIMTAKAHKGVQ
jgi:hypothetical protein